MKTKLCGLTLWALSLCAVFAPRALEAQDLPDVTNAPDEGLKLDVLGSAELRSGNVNLVLLNGQTWGRYRTGVHYASLRLSDSFGTQASDRFLNAFRGLAQYRYAILPELLGGLGLEGIVHYDRDEFRRREHLLNVGAGPYISVVAAPALRWNVTLAYVFEFEKFAKLTSPTDPNKGVRDSEFELNAHRAWIGSEFAWEPWQRVHLGEDVIFQVPLDHCPCDTRVYSTTFVRIYGNDYVALQTGLTVLYDSRPAVNVKQYDAIIRSSLVFSL